MSVAPDSLPALLDLAWHHLAHAVTTAHHGFHLPTLCTLGLDQRPAARIVVLRRFDLAERAVMCHTDRRAPKVLEIEADARASWVFYDGPSRLQLRASGVVKMHTGDALADTQWEASNLSSRRCYLAPRRPGSAVDHPSPNLPPEVRDQVPVEAATLPGRANFAVLRCVIESLDVLHLHHAGHHRAQFTWPHDPSLPPRMSWLEV